MGKMETIFDSELGPRGWTTFLATESRLTGYPISTVIRPIRSMRGHAPSYRRRLNLDRATSLFSVGYLLFSYMVQVVHVYAHMFVETSILPRLKGVVKRALMKRVIEGSLDRPTKT